MSLNDPHWGRSSDEEKKNDRGDNEQRSDGVGEDGEEQNARQNPNAQDDRNPADSSADGSRRTSRDAREDDEQRDRRSQGLLSDDDLENFYSNTTTYDYNVCADFLIQPCKISYLLQYT